MAFYSLSDEQVLRMPVRRFWLFEKNIGRLQAESDLRAINVVATPHVAKAGEIQARLVEEMGTVVIVNTPREENATGRLLALGGAAKG